MVKELIMNKLVGIEDTKLEYLAFEPRVEISHVGGLTFYKRVTSAEIANMDNVKEKNKYLRSAIITGLRKDFDFTVDSHDKGKN